MALVGCRYIQATDPGAVGAAYEWANTSTGNLYIRNTTDTAWVLIGNIDNASLGNVPITGATMTGALNGVTGWAPLDAPNFTTSTKLGGIDLATVNDLSAMETAIYNALDSKISSAISSSTATITVNSKIAKLTGDGYKQYSDSDQTFTIPLPTYPGSGETAAEADCVWMASIVGIAAHNSSVSNYDWTFKLVESPDRTYTFTKPIGVTDTSLKWWYQWIILAVKP